MKLNTSKASTIIKRYRKKKSGLLAVLQDIQDAYNWLPPEILSMVSEELSIPLIDVYSVASFYRAFSLTPRGKHLVTVCLGTACHVRGAPAVLDRLRDRLKLEPGCTSKDGNYTLETVACLGACALAPIVVVDGKYYGKATAKKADLIIENQNKEKPKAMKAQGKKKIKQKAKKKTTKKITKIKAKKKITKKPKRQRLTKKQIPAKRVKRSKKTTSIKRKKRKIITKKPAKKKIKKKAKKRITRSSKKKRTTKKRK